MKSEYIIPDSVLPFGYFSGFTLTPYPDGLDISSWQKEFDENLFKPDFVAIRAGNGLAADSYFEKNVLKYAGADIPIIAYWYIHPDLRAAEQIVLFLKTIQGHPIDAFCLDYEEWRNNAGAVYTCAEVSTHMVLSFSQLSAGVDVPRLVLYTSRAYIGTYIKPARRSYIDFLLDTVDLWIAIPANEPFEITPPFTRVLIRQYGAIKTPGFTDPVDHDSFIGTLAELREWAGFKPVVTLEDRVASLETRVTALENKGV